MDGELVPKRFCCGAIKRLKEKCLRFHDGNQEMCLEMIKGHEECKVVKMQYESQFKLAPEQPLLQGQ